MKILLLILLLFAFQTNGNCQNYNHPSAEQQREWHQKAEKEGKKTVLRNTAKNFYRNKLIFLIIGGAVALLLSKKVIYQDGNENKQNF